MDENQQHLNNVRKLDTGYDPLSERREYAAFEERTPGWSPERRKRFLTSVTVVLLAASVTTVALLEKYYKPGVVTLAEQDDPNRIPAEQIAEELGLEQMMIYNGDAVLKPYVVLRSSPCVIDEDNQNNEIGRSSNDPNNPTVLHNPQMVMDTKNPSNGYFLRGDLEGGKIAWVNQQNVIDFDTSNIQRFQLPEDQN